MSLDNYGKAENLLKKIKPYKMLFNKGLMFFLMHTPCIKHLCHKKLQEKNRWKTLY